MDIKLTGGALGKRTKYQQKEVAQLHDGGRNDVTEDEVR